jgi:hypothetical protein
METLARLNPCIISALLPAQRLFMPRRLFKRYMPNPDSIKGNKSLRFLGKLIHDPNLWHLNRHSVARGMAIGLFWAMIPMPMQMLAAAVVAIPMRANLPISIGLVWLTNPITMPPVFYCTYKLGAWIMQTPPVRMPETLSLEWITAEVAVLWKPLYLGSFVAGVILAILGYVLTMLYWRWWVQRSWRKRQEKRRLERR